MNRTKLDIYVSKISKKIFDWIENPITESVAFALAIIAIFFYFVSPHLPELNLKEGDLTNFGNFIEWFGVPYGLLIASVLVNVWTQFETTDREFDREADGVLALYNTCSLIADIKTRELINMILLHYAEHTRNRYSEEHINNTLKQIGEKRLVWIRKIIGELLLQDDKNEIVATELFRLVNKVIDDRGDRLAFAKQKMPKPVLALSFISSILWLLPFFTLSFSKPFIQILYIGGTTFVVASLMLIITDLDDPFHGTWRINHESWDDLVHKIKR